MNFFFSSWSNRNTKFQRVTCLSKSWSKASLLWLKKKEHFRCKVLLYHIIYNKFHLSLLLIYSSIFFSFEKRNHDWTWENTSFYFFLNCYRIKEVCVRILDVLLTFCFWEHEIAMTTTTTTRTHRIISG